MRGRCLLPKIRETSDHKINFARVYNFKYNIKLDVYEEDDGSLAAWICVYANHHQFTHWLASLGSHLQRHKR